MMLMRYANKKEIHDRVRSRLCNGLLNGNTHINRVEQEQEQELNSFLKTKDRPFTMVPIWDQRSTIHIPALLRLSQSHRFGR